MCYAQLAVNSLITALTSSLSIDSKYLALLLWHELAKEKHSQTG